MVLTVYKDAAECCDHICAYICCRFIYDSSEFEKKTSFFTLDSLILFFLSPSGITMFTMWKNTSICHLERLKVTLWVVGNQSAITEIICVAAASSPLKWLSVLFYSFHAFLPHIFFVFNESLSLFFILSSLLSPHLIPVACVSPLSLCCGLLSILSFSFNTTLYCYFSTVFVNLFLTHTQLCFLWRPCSQRECDFQQTQKNGKQLQMKSNCKGKWDLHDVTTNNLERGVNHYVSDAGKLG